LLAFICIMFVISIVLAVCAWQIACAPEGVEDEQHSD
jgi:hypothetical protein